MGIFAMCCASNRTWDKKSRCHNVSIN